MPASSASPVAAAAAADSSNTVPEIAHVVSGRAPHTLDMPEADSDIGEESEWMSQESLGEFGEGEFGLGAAGGEGEQDDIQDG